MIPVKRNVSLEMVKAGLACVYEGSQGSYDRYSIYILFERMKIELMNAEEEAKRKKRGMWNQLVFESPMQYKKRNKG